MNVAASAAAARTVTRSHRRQTELHIAIIYQDLNAVDARTPPSLGHRRWQERQARFSCEFLRDALHAIFSIAVTWPADNVDVTLWIVVSKGLQPLRLDAPHIDVCAAMESWLRVNRKHVLAYLPGLGGCHPSRKKCRQLQVIRRRHERFGTSPVRCTSEMTCVKQKAGKNIGRIEEFQSGLAGHSSHWRLGDRLVRTCAQAARPRDAKSRAMLPRTV